ncbi:hypothetical protein FZEAL_10716 [Fusarium zealandicum]|uniref:Lysine-specific metallo-endopeptidase domain-containing protein n=1 Tax=Fusarium zealandicum TaxID=1053134 RepID=A0A8H4TXX7_9HYPO|nr:hypothetical protein FZEAL_10716 [Fusarium zealandicum]
MNFFLLIALLTGLGSTADLSVWEFDGSCEPHRVAIQKAYNDAEIMAVKAQEDFKMLSSARPAYPAGRTQRISNWDRVSRAVVNMFGFVPNPRGHDTKEAHYSNVMYVFDRMVKTLQQGEMVPEKGYGGLKPLMVCTEDVFTWVGQDDADPHDPARRPLHESRPDVVKGGHVGAWVYKKRYFAQLKKDSVGICRKNKWAVTLTRFDFLILCPKSFTGEMAQTASAVDAKNGVKVSDSLDTFGHTSLSRVMVHEFAHWFGSDGKGAPGDRQAFKYATRGANAALFSSYRSTDGRQKWRLRLP